ncbi:MAG: toll/interleukin-1 receptor domain-containing protein [Candidatus Atribacteria bacterium]|nr:toll/interleukin-1 receptor domain-containing protein [Planctomycetota bacterium]MBE3120382.1 toll/interleukin-1 receptor domain-containing protein [Candidatus Atribacteria bacterium]
MKNTDKKWDVFISHASQDKEAFVRPLALALQSLGLAVWYDEFSLNLGDSISRSIDRGLADSAYGVVVISPSFIGKPWPEYELRGLVNREANEDKVILPIWHGVTRQQVSALSPSLADKLAVDTSHASPVDVAMQILRVVRPDLYAAHSRTELEQTANAGAILDLKAEIHRMTVQMEALREELAQYRCPYCGSPVAERIHAPLDEEEKNWGMREVYECGYVCVDGFLERPCPSDPRFPKLEDYELRFHHSPEEPHYKWQCYAVPKTDMARLVQLSLSLGGTREEAKARLSEHYAAISRKRNG